MIKSLHCCFCKKNSVDDKESALLFLQKKWVDDKESALLFLQKNSIDDKESALLSLHKNPVLLSMIIGVLENICEREGEAGLCKWNQREITEIS